MEQSITIIGFDGAFVKKFWKSTLITGIVLTLLGMAGVIVPQFASLVVDFSLGWLLLTAGFFALYVVYLSRWRSPVSWLKPVLLLVTGGLLLINPRIGIAALTLLLTFYLLLDAVTNFGMAHDYHPLHGWGWMVFNGLVSLFLAALILFGWPQTSAMLLGIYVGVSLLFDGLALIFMSLGARAMIKDEARV